MKITFLGQGFDGNSNKAVGEYLIKYLGTIGFHTFTGISAFASEAGIFGLSGHIQSAKSRFENINLFVGIDQDGTSKEALIEILNLNINSYIFYQSEAPIFHPKIYLFEGNKEMKLIIGSSNLTKRGLFTNTESSLLIEFNVDDTEGSTLLNELKTYYKSLFDFTDPNLLKIDTAIIGMLVANGIVPDEIARIKLYNIKSKPIITTLPANEDIRIPKRKIAKAPTSFPSKQRNRTISSTDNSEGSLILPINQNNILGLHLMVTEENLVWKSGPLTARDLNIPHGGNTNPTGSMLFKKGQMEDIDQRHYFRNVVFASLPWANDKTPKEHLERATAFFHIIIEGEDKGIFSLILTHNSKTNTKTYEQNNSMTQVSWGAAKAIIAREALIGKTASLYKDNDESNQFALVIE